MTVTNIIPFEIETKCKLDDLRPVLVKPGTYDVILADHWKGQLYGGIPKIMLVFRIVSVGQYYGHLLSRCYNVKGFTKRKEIIPKGWHSDFVREYSKLFGLPEKLRDVGIGKFKQKVIQCSVRTVTKDRKQRDLPKELRYSVVSELLTVKSNTT